METETCEFLRTFCIFETISIRFSVLYYKRENGKNIKNNGCTVDLLTKHSNMIKFKAGVKNKTADCLKDCIRATNTFDGASANLLVFYSIRNLPLFYFLAFPSPTATVQLRKTSRNSRTVCVSEKGRSV